MQTLNAWGANETCTQMPSQNLTISTTTERRAKKVSRFRVMETYNILDQIRLNFTVITHVHIESNKIHLSI